MHCPDSPDVPHSQSWTTDSQATRTHTFRGEHETHQVKKWLETPCPHPDPTPERSGQKTRSPHCQPAQIPPPTVVQGTRQPRTGIFQDLAILNVRSVHAHVQFQTQTQLDTHLLSSLAMLHWTDVGQESGGPRV